MKKIISLLLIGITLTFLPGCSQISETVDSISKSEPVITKSESGIFQVELLDGWKMPTKGELNEQADLEATKLTADSYFMAMMEKKSDYTLDLAGYSDLVLNTNAKAYGVTPGEFIPTKVGNYNAYLSEFTAVSESIKCHMWIYAIETETYYGQLFVWTTESKVDQNKDELMKIINSFKEISQTTP